MSSPNQPFLQPEQTFIQQPKQESSGFMSTITNFFSKNKKCIITVIVVLVLIFLLYKFYLKDKYFSKSNEQFNDNQLEQEEFDQQASEQEEFEQENEQ